MEVDSSCDPEMVMESLNRILPEGIQVLEATAIPRSSPSLAVITDSTLYRVTLPIVSPMELGQKVESFMALETFPYHRGKKGKTMVLDLRKELVDMSADGSSLEMKIKRGKPLEFAEAITGLNASQLKGARIEKLEVFFKG
jgi:radical SAM-linked protein